MTYNVGSRDERPGRTGFAHLFEHMLFQGSENVGKGEHFILIQNNGGSANGTTNTDRTNYFETLPANQLELAIFLEADRMRAPAITQANFDNQRATVQEERRQNYDNRAYGKTYEAVIDLAYDNFPYKHSTIGSMDDLNAATLDDATAFFRTYYAPNNAVLSMVGSFKTETALALIKKYFENIPAQPAPAPPDMSEPEQKAERRKTHRRRLRANAAPRYRVQDSAGQYAGLVCLGIARAGSFQRRVVAAVSEVRQGKRDGVERLRRRRGEARAVAVLVQRDGAADHRSRRPGKTALRRDRADSEIAGGKIRS